MNVWRTLLVLALAALVPLVAPGAWLHGGGFPNVAILAVVYVALEAGPAPAAWCGAVIGFVMCPWTVEPLGQSAFLLGMAGFVTGTVRQSFNRDLAVVQLAMVAVAALAVRVVGEALAAGAGGGGAGAGIAAGFRSLPTALLTAVVTAVVAPPMFGLFDRVRLLKRRARRRAGV